MWGKNMGKRVGLSGLAAGLRLWVWAQADGDAGLNQANSMVRDYFDTAINLVYGIGGIVGLVGAIRVYIMWSNGEPHMGRVATAWFGACIFLVVVASVLKSFYGLT